jgi:hypothetical protein
MHSVYLSVSPLSVPTLLEVFSCLSCPGTQRLLQLWTKEAQLPWADLVIVYKMLVLQASKRQELWDHVGFHSDFKGISGNVLQPALKGWCVRLWRWSLSCSGDTSILGMPECGYQSCCGLTLSCYSILPFWNGNIKSAICIFKFYSGSQIRGAWVSEKTLNLAFEQSTWLQDFGFHHECDCYFSIQTQHKIVEHGDRTG